MDVETKQELEQAAPIEVGQDPPSPHTRNFELDYDLLNAKRQEAAVDGIRGTEESRTHKAKQDSFLESRQGIAGLLRRI